MAILGSPVERGPLGLRWEGEGQARWETDSIHGSTSRGGGMAGAQGGTGGDLDGAPASRAGRNSLMAESKPGTVRTQSMQNSIRTSNL